MPDPACRGCGGSGLVVPSPFDPSVDPPSPWAAYLDRYPWGYPPLAADARRAWLRPAPCPWCATPGAAHAAVDPVDDDDDVVTFRLTC